MNDPRSIRSDQMVDYLCFFTYPKILRPDREHHIAFFVNNLFIGISNDSRTESSSYNEQQRASYVLLFLALQDNNLSIDLIGRHQPVLIFQEHMGKNLNTIDDDINFAWNCPQYFDDFALALSDALIDVTVPSPRHENETKTKPITYKSGLSGFYIFLVILMHFYLTEHS